MNVNDIDLDVASLLEKVPEDNITFCLRAGEGSKDFLYMKGDFDSMVGTIANVMKQYNDVAEIIVNAALEYQKE